MIALSRFVGAIALAAVAALSAAPRAQAADYFPLKVGDKWTYVGNPQGSKIHSTQFTTAVDKVTRSAVTGLLYYHLQNYQGSDHWVHKTAAGRIYERPSDLWYRLAVPPGTTWPMAIQGGLPGSDGATLTLASRTETVSVAAGTFQNCIRIDYKTGVADAGVTSEWFAPGVGLVRRVESRIYGTWTSELSEADVSGKHYPQAPSLVATLTITPDNLTMPGQQPPTPPTFPITATLHVASSGAPVKVTVGGFSADFVIHDPSGNEVYRWSTGKFFPQFLMNTTIDQKGVDYTQTLTPGYLPAGTCTVEGISHVSPAPAPVSVQLTVVQAP